MSQYRQVQYSTSSKATPILLKCFCGCSELTVEEVKRFYRFSARETLINTKAAKLLRKHLELKRRGDKSVAEQMLDVYEMCNKYLNETNILTEDELEELSDLGLPYEQERDLLENIQTGNTLDIQRCLFRIQGVCSNEIEGSENYRQFKNDLLGKLRQVERR